MTDTPADLVARMADSILAALSVETPAQPQAGEVEDALREMLCVYEGVYDMAEDPETGRPYRSERAEAADAAARRALSAETPATGAKTSNAERIVQSGLRKLRAMTAAEKLPTPPTPSAVREAVGRLKAMMQWMETPQESAYPTPVLAPQHLADLSTVLSALDRSEPSPPPGELREAVAKTFYDALRKGILTKELSFADAIPLWRARYLDGADAVIALVLASQPALSREAVSGSIREALAYNGVRSELLGDAIERATASVMALAGQGEGTT